MLFFRLFTNPLPTSYFCPTELGCLSPCVFPSIVLVRNARCAWNSLHLAATETRCALLSSKGMFHGCSGFLRRCKALDREGDFVLEMEVLEFMESSRNPDAFPSKKDLIEAGREDLVDAIVKKGGWLCLGWDLDAEDDGGIGLFSLDDREFILATDWESFGESNSSKCDERQRFATAVSPIASASTPASFTGRSLETVVEHESGIEGMLSRLEKERNATFGAASEIALSAGRSGEVLDVLRYETLGYREDSTNSNSGEKEMNHNQMRRHLHHMELELSSAIGSLRSDAFASDKGRSKSSDDLLELSDAFEFQENEILNAKDKLRSTRAKLAVVEGKMALTIIDAQKVIEEKQKSIKCARRAFQMLRTACVVWSNSASEVLLVGSFDGWSTQRKMERSSTGVFSLFLKLYPGKYEIKFIVDGQWKIDALRPVVSSDGHENNLLIIT